MVASCSVKNDILYKGARYLFLKMSDMASFRQVSNKRPWHLLAKIVRKKIKDPEREITVHNYKSVVTDLIGIRALHLFKEDWVFIHKFIEMSWETSEEPIAYIRQGDTGPHIDEYKKFNCDVKLHPYGYRSVYYLVEVAPSKNRYTAEIQVRTIFEEGWSEIDHTIKYPNNIGNSLLDKFLDAFNILAGSSDHMGSFVRHLKYDLLKGTEKIEECEKLLEENTATINELKKRVAGTIGMLNFKIRKVEAQMGILSSREVVAESFEEYFAKIKDTAFTFELTLATDPEEAARLLESTEHRLERLGKLLEMTIEEQVIGESESDTSEEDMIRSYKKNVIYFIHNIKILADMEEGMGQRTLVGAIHEQEETQMKVRDAVNDMRRRRGLVKFLIGPKYGSIRSLYAAVDANETRMVSLTSAVNSIADHEVAFALEKQIIYLLDRTINCGRLSPKMSIV